MSFKEQEEINRLTRECLNFVADLCETRTEYDGKMLTYCFFCGEWLDEHDHAADCLHIRVKKMLEE